MELQKPFALNIACASNPATHIGVALTRAIVEQRLHPGTKLAEQELADHFGVSRTLVRKNGRVLARRAR